MPFSGTTFTLPAGATTQVPGNIVQSATWNSINSDLNMGLTQVMSQLAGTSSFRNCLWANGGFEVWQRGAGSASSISVAASTTAYTSDRWYLTTGALQAHVVSAVAGMIGNSQLAAKVLRTAGQTGVTALTFGYPLSTDSIVRIQGDKVSFSCLVKTGANWSPTNGTLTPCNPAG